MGFATLEGAGVMKTVWSSLLILFTSAVSMGWADEANQQVEKPDIIVVVGAGGTSDYSEQFKSWSEQWVDVARRSNANLTRIGISQTSSDREELEKTMKQIAGQSKRSAVWIVLIGHGTFARNSAKFNLRGPDVSAAELGDWIEPIERTIVIVACTSSSGPYVNRLSGKNRIVVTATKSGQEHNFSRFGEYFASAIASPDSDLDHDDEISVHEAFVRASREVEGFYQQADRLSTEHALIDDNGDGLGTPANMFHGTRVVGQSKNGESIDGKQAARITLSPAGNRLQFLADELIRRQQIEQELEQLKLRKSELEPKVYQEQLEGVLVKLARLYQMVERRTSKMTSANE